MSARSISILFSVSMMIFSCLFSVAAHAVEPKPPHCRLAIADTLLPDFHCTASKADCYTQAVKALKDQAREQNIELEGCPVPPDDTYLSEFDFTGTHSAYAFVFLPGLYDTAEQFWNFKNTFGANNGMRVVLPGHGASASQGGALTPQDWITATRRAVTMASYLGDKVILVGQSTGAFMAMWAAAQPELNVAGVAVFEPAMKVRSYYGASLCYIPPFDLAVIPHGRFFEENVNLGCVIRLLSLEQTPQLMLPQTLARLSKIPFYIFVNDYDIVVSTGTTLKFARALKAAGGDVVVESYNEKYEGEHMHAAVVRLPLRPRFAEHLTQTTSDDFAQTIRGRNSYAEFMATRFNVCDTSATAGYLRSFASAYNSIFSTAASVTRIDAVISELGHVTGLARLSKETQATMQAYKNLYTASLQERDGWSFPTDGQHFIMKETDWKELRSLCCDTVFTKNKRFYTATFQGPTYTTLKQQKAQVSADIDQAIAGRIDAVVAQRLVAYLTDKETSSLLSPLIAGDFAATSAWASGSGTCKAWQDIPAMDVSVDDMQSEAHAFVNQNSGMEQTPDD